MTHPVATLARRTVLLLPCAAVLVLALACQYESAGSAAPTAPTSAVTPKLGVTPDFVSLQVGASQQFQVTLLDVNGKLVDDPSVTWSAGDAEVAAVDARGFVIAMAPGQTTVTAAYGPDITASAQVVVLPAEPRRAR